MKTSEIIQLNNAVSRRLRHAVRQPLPKVPVTVHVHVHYHGGGPGESMPQAGADAQEEPGKVVLFRPRRAPCAG